MTTGNTHSNVNVKLAVPFFAVSDLARSLEFYVTGLGCEMTREWVVDGVRRWCWLELGDASLMLQQFPDGPNRPPRVEGALGAGVAICFQCVDALDFYREIKDQGLAPSRPFVGNHMWVTSIQDPDGYRLEFQSPTDVPEETELEE